MPDFTPAGRKTSKSPPRVTEIPELHFAHGTHKCNAVVISHAVTKAAAND